MFHEKIHSMPVLLVKFVTGFTLKFMYLALIVSIMSCFFDPLGFQLLVLLA